MSVRFLTILTLIFGLNAVASPAIEFEKKKPFEVNLKLENFNKEQEAKVLKAAELIRKVVASDAFREGVLSHTYKGEVTFADNNGLTNEEIYKKIIEGSEELNPGIDNKMDLELEVYFENTKTVGYTRPSVVKVWMNSKYLDRNNPAQVTTNMMHEWLHKIGFKHEMHHSERRMHTVPYAIGYLMEKIAKEIYASEKTLTASREIASTVH